MKILFFSIDPVLNFKKAKTLTIGFLLMLALSLIAAYKLNNLNSETYLSYALMIFSVAVNFYFAYTSRYLQDVAEIKRDYLNGWIEAVLLCVVYVLVTRVYYHNYSVSRVELGIYIFVACFILSNYLKRRKKVQEKQD